MRKKERKREKEVQISSQDGNTKLENEHKKFLFCCCYRPTYKGVSVWLWLRMLLASARERYQVSIGGTFDITSSVAIFVKRVVVVAFANGRRIQI